MIKNQSNQLPVICLLWFIFSLFPLFSSSLVAADLKKEEKKHQKELQLVKKELIEISQDLKKSQQTKNAQIKKIEAFDKEISDFRKAIQKTQSTKKSTKKEIAALRKKSSQLNRRVTDNKKVLAEMTVAMYQRGEENYLKILLNHNDASEQSRMRMYYEYFNQSFNEKQKKLNTDLIELSSIDDALKLKIEDLDRTIKKLKKDTEALKLQRNDKKAYLVKITQKIKSKKQRISTLTNNRKTLNKLLRALKKRRHKEALARKSGMSFAKHKGKLKWPVKGKIRHKFGQRRENSELRWRGMLISVKMGEKVHAVDAGTVVFADWLSGYGYVLIIEHGKGYMSLYGHNQQLLKEVGDVVSANTVIAEAGSSGRISKPGLYFEIRKNGKPVNPKKWMSARTAR